jgi:hypothetical protein
MYASVYECIFTLEVGNHIHIRKLKSEHFLVLGKRKLTMQEKKIWIRQPLVGHKTRYILLPGDENMPKMIAY